jgi:acetyl-CoA C-acetyltransferase
VTRLASNTPVIVGVGFEQQKIDDPTLCSEAYVLMVNAVLAAAADAGSEKILSHVESISVPQGLWSYRNPGRLIADAIGCPGAKSILSDLGVLQLTLLSDLCHRIAAGEQDIGVVTGGEAKYRELRSTITRTPVSETHQPRDTPAPDEHLTSSDPFCSDLESKRGFSAAVDAFAVIESALRYHEGLGIEEHRDKIARMYAGFSQIAARNPHAWRREPFTAEQIRNPTAKNTMQAFPYTKLHCSQWNVNQAIAIIVCSVGKAEELGLSRDRWIYPLSAAESKHVVVLAQQRRLHSHPGTIMTGERALALARVSRSDIGAAELYSCFPAAIRSFAHDLRLEPGCQWTVTGAMAFAGGPFNHASLAGVARMVEVLRDGSEYVGASARRVGFVSNLSGIFGKQGCAVFSSVANGRGYRYEDVTDAVAEVDQPVPLNGDYVGPATVVGYTVMFAGGGPSHGLAICDTAEGERTVVRSEDRRLIETMCRNQYCGSCSRVDRGGFFESA